MSKLSFLYLSVLLAAVFNLVILDLDVFSRDRGIQSPVEPTVNQVLPAAECPGACSTLIEQKISSLPFPPIVPTATARPTDKTSQPSAVKEYYVPLGSGKTQSSDYEQILSAEATVDTQNFGQIKEVIFEVFVRIPTGNGRVFVKLYNLSAGHDVWFSEVWSETDRIVKKEAKINLDTGKKTYRLMAKSTMKYEAVIEQARLKILTY